jgi:hypothetical protein
VTARVQGTTSRRLSLVAAVAALALLGAGCGIRDPYNSPGSATTSTAAVTTGAAAAVTGDPAPERGGTIPAAAVAAQNRLSADAPTATAQAALQRYGTLYVNWDAANVLARQRQLAAMSVGEARAQAEQAAASIPRDTLLTRSHVANHGQVVAVAAGRGAQTGRWVVVTRESTTGTGSYAGLPPTSHVIYAQVARVAGGWVVSQWQPQS